MNWKSANIQAVATLPLDMLTSPTRQSEQPVRTLSLMECLKLYGTTDRLLCLLRQIKRFTRSRNSKALWETYQQLAIVSIQKVGIINGIIKN